MRNENNNLSNWKHLRQSKGKAGVDDKDLQKIWDHSNSYGQGFEPNVEFALKQLKNRIAKEPKVVRLTPVRKWMRIAAAILFLSLATVATYKYISNNTITSPSAWVNINTANNEQRDIILPDGSVITLNKNSHLSYASDINTATKRLVQLEGEAFFKVNRRPEQAFLITTPLSEVEVLGTSFNVRAYPDEAETEVEVSTGRVAFRDRKHQQESILEANQVAILDKENKLTEISTPALNRKAWKTGLLSFKETKIETALPLIARYYGIQLLTNANLSSCTISGDWEDETLEDALELIEYLSGGGIEIKKISEGVYQVNGNCE